MDGGDAVTHWVGVCRYSQAYPFFKQAKNEAPLVGRSRFGSDEGLRDGFTNLSAAASGARVFRCHEPFASGR
jgi:hypothetical protein